MFEGLDGLIKPNMTGSQERRFIEVSVVVLFCFVFLFFFFFLSEQYVHC